jgi:hypothetical protein
MTIKEKIESYVGLIPTTVTYVPPPDGIDTLGRGAVVSDASLNNWLKEAVITLLGLLPIEKLGEVAVMEENVTEDGSYDVRGKRVYACKRGLYNAPFVSPRMAPNVIDVNSIYYASNTSPVSILQNGFIQVYPGGEVYTVAYPITVSVSATTIPGLPAEFEPGAVLSTAIKVQIAKINKTMTLPSVDLAGISVPTTPITPAFTFDDINLEVYTAPVLGDLGTVPSFTVPTATIDFSISGLVDATEDTELASVQIGKINSQINKLQTDVQANLQSFNAANNAYQVNLQKLVENAHMSQQQLLTRATQANDVNTQNSIRGLERQIANYKSELERYQSQLQAYQTMVTGQVQAYYYDVQNYAIREKALFQLLGTLKGEYNEFLQMHLGVRQAQQQSPQQAEE